MNKVIIAGYQKDSSNKRHATYGDIKRDSRAGVDAFLSSYWRGLSLPISASLTKWTVVAPNELLEWNND